MSKQDGGPAFPGRSWELLTEDNRLSSGRVNDSISVTYSGMTLRDYFASQALPSLIALDLMPEQCVETAYRLADAMLKERAK